MCKVSSVLNKTAAAASYCSRITIVTIPHPSPVSQTPEARAVLIKQAKIRQLVPQF
jgi:hypothetical protein